LDTVTARKFHAAYGVAPAQALGVMEVGLPLINLPHPEIRPSSVGRAQFGFEVQIRDEAGLPCHPGTTGQLFIRGPGLFDAYVAPWRNREEIIGKEGWFATGEGLRWLKDLAAGLSPGQPVYVLLYASMMADERQLIFGRGTDSGFVGALSTPSTAGVTITGAGTANAILGVPAGAIGKVFSYPPGNAAATAPHWVHAYFANGYHVLVVRE
jgi:hypothetical protein